MRRSSKGFVALVLWLSASASAVAAPAAPTTSAAPQPLYGNISEGHLGLSASVSIDSTKVESADANTTFTFSTRNHYFVADRVGLGGVLFLQTRTNLTNLRVGPSVQWYFWNRDRLGAHVSQDVTIRVLSSPASTASSFQTDSLLGLDYFLYPSVAIGPALEFFHQFRTSSFALVNEFTFLGQLSIFL
ncbi:MAG: hypothetical protein HY075_16895 [Deltaproteobacteria bacterium]|nr:hypothetical protein [Deltaproteobacteria bacterium]